MNVCFVDIILPQFLTDIIVNTIILEVGYPHARFETLDELVRNYC